MPLFQHFEQVMIFYRTSLQFRKSVHANLRSERIYKTVFSFDRHNMKQIKHYTVLNRKGDSPATRATAIAQYTLLNVSEHS